MHLPEANRRQELSEHSDGRIGEGIHHFDEHQERAFRPKTRVEHAYPVDNESPPEHKDVETENQLENPTDEQNEFHRLYGRVDKECSVFVGRALVTTDGDVGGREQEYLARHTFYPTVKPH